MNKHLQFFLGFSIACAVCAAQTTVTLQPNSSSGEDAYIDNRLPNSNFGSIEDFMAAAWTNSGTETIVRSLVKFDLSSIPTNAVVNSASLTLYAYNSVGNQTHSTLSGSNAALIQKITDSWSESTVTWNNQPTTSAINQLTLAASTSTNQNYTINVTAHVQDMVANPSTNFGFMLKLITEQYYRKLVFASSDNANAGLWPKLEINYTVPTVSCITIQPNATDGKDAYVDSRLNTSNFANQEDFICAAWTNASVPTTVRGLIEFDLSQIPSNATINSASLSLFAYNSIGNQTHSTLSGSNASLLQRVTSSWTENNVTWDNQPTTTSVNQVTLAASTSTTQNYTNIDVTGLVIDMKNNPSSSFGFMLRLITEQYYRKLVFASSDNTNASIRPKLEICYTSDVGTKEITNKKAEGFIYPNPSTSFVNIEITNASDKYYSINISDYTGKSIITLNNLTPVNNLLNETINYSDFGLTQGIYIISVTSDSQIFSKKLIVE